MSGYGFTLTWAGLVLAVAPAAARAADDYTVAAYYFPNYHPDARNEARYGADWTEWELVKRAEPRFPGHRQPRVPAWGYTSEADPQEMVRKIDAAAGHGVDVFIYDWYYYDDGLFLERGLEQGYMKAPNNDRVKFCLMWANHDWIDIHPAKPGCTPLLYPGKIKPETWERMTDYIIRTYFAHPSHWRIDGKPYFSFYDLSMLVESLGGVEKTARALRGFRDKAIGAGLPGIHLNAVVWGLRVLPGEQAVRRPEELVEQLGFDSVTSYVWVHHVPMKAFPETPYEWMMEKSIAYWSEAAERFRVPYFPNVTMGWDSSPRTIQTEKFANQGYPYTSTLSGNTPEAFRKALVQARRFMDRSSAPKILTINAWNEWTEGSYLEPDTVTGMGYLEAIREVFGSKAATSPSDDP
jgi:hypothetical protein